MRKLKFSNFLIFAFLLILSFVFLIPIITVISNSFKDKFSISQTPFVLPNSDTFAGIENYIKGVELVLKQFQDVLKSKGVEEIKALGETFDPELHEAVSSVQDDSKGEKEIVQEYRKGYKIGHKVIRHSMVVVAN